MLSSTIKIDFTSPSFKYHDDPYLIPLSNPEKRNYSLSQESGRLAARYFLNKYPQLFEDYIDHPNVKKFYSTNSKLNNILSQKSSEDKLIQLVYVDAPFEDIMSVYNDLKSNNIEINFECQLLILQYFAFFNSSDPNYHNHDDYFEGNASSDEIKSLTSQDDNIISEPGDDMYWYKHYTGIQPYTQRWKNLGIANQIWSDMKYKTSEAYTIIISALSKYMNADKSFALYDEMKSKSIPLNVKIYNSLLALIPLQQDNAELQWNLAKKLMEEMSLNCVIPDLYTFNNSLRVVTKIRDYKIASSICFQLLAEMQRCRIEPSLATFLLVLNCFYRDKRSYSTIIYDVVDNMQGREYSIRHPQDIDFFTTAMSICRFNLQDKNLAHQIMDLYHFGKNKIMIGNDSNHRSFFFHYFKILFKNESLENIIAIYDKLIPSEYCADPIFIKDILAIPALVSKSFDNYEPHFIIRLWTDSQLYGILRPLGDDKVIENSTNIYKMFTTIIRKWLENNKKSKLDDHVLVDKPNDTYTPPNQIDDLQNEKLGEICKSFGKVALDIVARLEANLKSDVIKGSDNILAEEKRVLAKLEGRYNGMLEDLLIIFAETDLDKELWKLLKKFSQSRLTQEISPETLEKLIKKTVNCNDSDNSLVCLKIYVKNAYPETVKICQQYFSESNESGLSTKNISLSDTQRIYKDNLIHDYEMLKDKRTSKQQQN
ncbi:small ribosomal subunit protein mS39-like [Gordionus sp. m RMFG-2023]|uniref:small ribosomal subunit protein mS39-like n=1 Tax=Gordionus sp. m RMFG-2023 TaxID=3053472 RepID=UPI0031FBAD93